MSFFETEEQEQLIDTDNSLWVERYRPSRLDDYIGNEFLKERVSNFLEDNDIPHLLFHGRAGTGKTTISKLIANTMDCDYMIINASDENNVDTVRDKVKGFASTVGFKDKKIMILDECLDENTMVWILRDGVEQSIAIKDVNDKTDLVKSYNTEENRVEYRPFMLWDRGVQDVFEIELENGEVVVCTSTHKWYVEDENGDHKVVKTEELEKYNHILSPTMRNDEERSHPMKKIGIKSIRKKPNRAQVYDLSVEDNHNFFIGETQTLTHNCDYLTPNAQALLRNLMETFSKNCRFILTCNYIEKVIEAVQSRCQIFEVIPPSRKEIAVHVSNILNKEQVEFDPKDIVPIIDTTYPDIRKIINTLQLASSKGKLKVDRKKVIESDYKTKVLQILQSDNTSRNKYREIRQVVANSRTRDFTEAYTFLHQKVDEYAGDNTSLVILALAEGQYQDSLVIDKEIQFMATLINILELI